MIILFSTLFFFSTIFGCLSSVPENDRPIIGIVTEELNSTIVIGATSMIVASYVKYLESAGARVVPIWIYKERNYYEDIMSKINGVLLPGGGGILTSPGYGKTGQIIYDIATRMNEHGDFFPVWGTCLGFELLNLAAIKKNWMTACDALDFATNIEFVNEYKKSKMFHSIEPGVERAMKEEDTVIHYHRWCFTEQNYTKSGLNKLYKVLAVNRDRNNMTFISIIEAYMYPFFGVAFHPEKAMFEWVQSDTHKNIPHSLDALKVSQHFADFFVDEARRNTHRFPNKEAEDAELIYNYQPVFTGQYGTHPVIQTYFFGQ